ncbi:DNA damage-regulated autophagy modulator protein 1-like [Pogona vitticeps]
MEGSEKRPSPGRDGLPARESLRRQCGNPGPAADGPRKASHGGGEAVQQGRKGVLAVNSGKACSGDREALAWQRWLEASWQSWRWSDTGAKPPENVIFGIMITISALLGAITMTMRYLILRRQNKMRHFISSSLNLLALCFGILGCIGMCIVARFPELTYPAIHDGGALMAFVSGTVYIVLQTAISYKLYKECPQWCTPRIWHTRLVLSVVTIMALVPMITCDSLISITKIDWNPGEKEYVYHLVGAVCEWIVAFSFEMFFLTFVSDFQRASEVVTEIPKGP